MSSAYEAFALEHILEFQAYLRKYHVDLDAEDFSELHDSALDYIDECFSTCPEGERLAAFWYDWANPRAEALALAALRRPGGADPEKKNLRGDLDGSIWPT